ncbi:ATP-binding protein [Labilibaculum filiforme]|nr:transporter substrate-binding domain-containing protein [Labilibaculum filiforme]
MKLSKYIFLLIVGLIFTIPSCTHEKEDILTQKERMWLKAHPNIRVAVSTTFPPFQFTDVENNSTGVSVDILSLLEQNIDYKFKKVYYDNWKKILDAGKAKEIDVLIEIQETVERREYFNFTKAFISIPHVIIMRKNGPDQISIDELENLKIGIVDNYAVHEHLKNLYPELNLYPLPNDRACLISLSNQKIDAVITQQAYAIYEIHKEMISNLQIVGDIEYDNELGFAIRKDWTILSRIIDKGLSRITTKEQDKILNKWVPIQASPFWQSKIFISILILVFLSFILVLVIIYFWNKSLRKSVATKTLQLRRAKEQAEKSNLLKSSFLANMSHEIRTPLNAIQGFTELLTNENLNSQQKEKYANIINTNCKSLTNLIDEILDLSKIESGLATIKNQDFELISCIQDVIDANSTSILEKPNLKIEFSNQLNVKNLTIHTDPFRLKQILNNLLSNAIKFSTHGKITIKVSYKNSSQLLFSVQDDGIGIDKLAIPLIFDRFTKIEKDSTILYRGSGLGLSICKKLLQLMNGEIWVKSTIGVGSSFYFTLPVSQQTVLDK